MMDWLPMSAVLLTAAMLAQPQAGELPTGSRLANRPLLGPKLSAEDEALGAKAMADCMYDQNVKLARAALLAANKEIAEKALGRMSGNINCSRLRLGNDLVDARVAKFSTEVLRGMLAERSLIKAGPALATLTALPLQKVYQRSWFAVTGRHLSVDEMGACIADTNPVGIAALVRTVPTSREEGAAFGALGANLSQCLRVGTKLQANRQSLRAALADALFQRLYAPAPAPSVEAAKK
jgi:hypothetical protein